MYLGVLRLSFGGCIVPSLISWFLSKIRSSQGAWCVNTRHTLYFVVVGGCGEACCRWFGRTLVRAVPPCRGVHTHALLISCLWAPAFHVSVFFCAFCCRSSLDCLLLSFQDSRTRLLVFKMVNAGTLLEVGLVHTNGSVFQKKFCLIVRAFVVRQHSTKLLAVCVQRTSTKFDCRPRGAVEAPLQVSFFVRQA